MQILFATRAIITLSGMFRYKWELPTSFWFDFIVLSIHRLLMIMIKIEETMAEISIILMAIPHFSCVHTKLLVQFSPVGQYFASASHDRTARIWSMDRIQPLRIMAGHLSDVDVSSFYIYFIGLVVWIWLQQSSSWDLNRRNGRNAFFKLTSLINFCIHRGWIYHVEPALCIILSQQI